MIAEILPHKGTPTFSVVATATITEVVETLGGKRIGAVLVMDCAGQLLGIASERDVVRSLRRDGPCVAMTAGRS